MITFLKSFADDTSGATAIEYGLIAVLLGVVLIAGATNFSDSIDGMFGHVGNTMQEANPS